MKRLSSQSGKNWRSAKIGRQGDPDAPVGSEEWAAYVANEIHSRVKDAESDARQAEGWIKDFKSENGHKALGFESWDEFCKSWIGYEADQVETIISRRKKTQKKAQEYSGDELKAHGGDRSGGKGNAGDLDPNERGSDYLTARIARDHPEVHERMKDGEFSSVRQAAIEAGIIDDIRTKQIRETDGREKMEAKIRHVYGDEVADRLFSGEIQADPKTDTDPPEAPDPEEIDPERAAIYVGNLQSAYRDGERGFQHVPNHIKRIIKEGLWRRVHAEETGQTLTFDTFREFVTAPPPEGLGANPGALVAMCQDDPEALGLLRRHGIE